MDAANLLIPVVPASGVPGPFAVLNGLLTGALDETLPCANSEGIEFPGDFGELVASLIKTGKPPYGASAELATTELPAVDDSKLPNEIDVLLDAQGIHESIARPAQLPSVTPTSDVPLLSLDELQSGTSANSERQSSDASGTASVETSVQQETRPLEAETMSASATRHQRESTSPDACGEMETTESGKHPNLSFAGVMQSSAAEVVETSEAVAEKMDTDSDRKSAAELSQNALPLPQQAIPRMIESGSARRGSDEQNVLARTDTGAVLPATFPVQSAFEPGHRQAFSGSGRLLPSVTRDQFAIRAESAVVPSPPLNAVPDMAGNHVVPRSGVVVEKPQSAAATEFAPGSASDNVALVQDVSIGGDLAQQDTAQEIIEVPVQAQQSEAVVQPVKGNAARDRVASPVIVPRSTDKVPLSNAAQQPAQSSELAPAAPASVTQNPSPSVSPVAAEQSTNEEKSRRLRVSNQASHSTSTPAPPVAETSPGSDSGTSSLNLDTAGFEPRTHDQIIAEALRHAEFVKPGERDQWEVRLDPPELGEMVMEIHRSSDGHVSVHLAAHSAETQSLLERFAADLTQSLNQQGIDLSQSGFSGQGSNSHWSSPQSQTFAESPGQSSPAFDQGQRDLRESGRESTFNFRA